MARKCTSTAEETDVNDEQKWRDKLIPEAYRITTGESYCINSLPLDLEADANG